MRNLENSPNTETQQFIPFISQLLIADVARRFFNYFGVALPEQLLIGPNLSFDTQDTENSPVALWYAIQQRQLWIFRNLNRYNYFYPMVVAALQWMDDALTCLRGNPLVISDIGFRFNLDCSSVIGLLLLKLQQLKTHIDLIRLLPVERRYLLTLLRNANQRLGNLICANSSLVGAETGSALIFKLRELQDPFAQRLANFLCSRISVIQQLLLYELKRIKPGLSIGSNNIKLGIKHLSETLDTLSIDCNRNWTFTSETEYLLTRLLFLTAGMMPSVSQESCQMATYKESLDYVVDYFTDPDNNLSTTVDDLAILINPENKLQTHQHYLYLSHHFIRNNISVVYISYAELGSLLQSLVVTLNSNFCSLRALRFPALVLDEDKKHFFYLDIQINKPSINEITGSMIVFDPAGYLADKSTLRYVFKTASKFNLVTYYLCSVAPFEPKDKEPYSMHLVAGVTEVDKSGENRGIYFYSENETWYFHVTDLDVSDPEEAFEINDEEIRQLLFAMQQETSADLEEQLLNKMDEAYSHRLYKLLNMQKDVNSCGLMALMLIELLTNKSNLHESLPQLHRDSIAALSLKSRNMLHYTKEVVGCGDIKLLPWSALPEVLHISQSYTFLQLHNPNFSIHGEHLALYVKEFFLYAEDGFNKPQDVDLKNNFIIIGSNNLITIIVNDQQICAAVSISEDIMQIARGDLDNYLRSVTDAQIETLKLEILKYVIESQELPREFFAPLQNMIIYHHHSAFAHQQHQECCKDPVTYAARIQQDLDKIKSIPEVVRFIIFCNSLKSQTSSAVTVTKKRAHNPLEVPSSNKRAHTLFSVPSYQQPHELPQSQKKCV